MEQPISQEDFKEFVGFYSWDYYADSWSHLLGGQRKKWGWNWAAFFIPEIYFVYRKMYWNFAIIWAIGFSFEMLSIKWAPNWIVLIWALVLRIGCGAYGNWLYLGHAYAVIEDVRKQGFPDVKRSEELAERGGTNFKGAVGVVLFLTVVGSVIRILRE